MFLILLLILILIFVFDALQPRFDQRRVVLHIPRHRDEPSSRQRRPRLIQRLEEMPIRRLESLVLDEHLPHRAVLRKIPRPVIDGPELHTEKCSPTPRVRQYPSSDRAPQCTLR